MFVIYIAADVRIKNNILLTSTIACSQAKQYFHVDVRCVYLIFAIKSYKRKLILKLSIYALLQSKIVLQKKKKMSMEYHIVWRVDYTLTADTSGD